MRLPSASSLGRVMHCTASHVLPPVQEAQSAAAAHGTAIHRWVERARTVGREAALAEVADIEVRRECSALDLDAIPAGAESEVAMGYHPNMTPRTIRYDLASHRDYPDDGRFHVTADLVGVLPDRAWGRDIKSGPQEVTPADSWQLRLTGLAAARYTDRQAAEEGFLVKLGDRWMEDTATFDDWDLDGFDLELLRLEERLAAPEAKDSFSVGAWCRYCPRLRVCPAHVTQIAALVPTLPGAPELVVPTVDQIVERMKAMTPEALGSAWPTLKALGELYDHVYSAFKEITGPEGLPLPNGQTLAWKGSGTQPSFAAGATAYVLKHYGAEVLADVAKLDIKALPAKVVEALEAEGLLDRVPKAESLTPMGKARKR